MDDKPKHTKTFEELAKNSHTLEHPIGMTIFYVIDNSAKNEKSDIAKSIIAGWILNPYFGSDMGEFSKAMMLYAIHDYGIPTLRFVYYTQEQLEETFFFSENDAKNEAFKIDLKNLL